MKYITKRRLAGALILLVLVAASVGFAAWLVDSLSGPARAKSGTLTAPVVSLASQAEYNAVSPAPAPCLPNANCGAVLAISNPNSAALTLYGIVAGTGTARTIDTAGNPVNPECDGKLTLNPAKASGLSIATPAGSSVVHVADGLTMASNTPSTCQGLFWSVPVVGRFQAGS